MTSPLSRLHWLKSRVNGSDGEDWNQITMQIWPINRNNVNNNSKPPKPGSTGSMSEKSMKSFVCLCSLLLDYIFLIIFQNWNKSNINNNNTVNNDKNVPNYRRERRWLNISLSLTDQLTNWLTRWAPCKLQMCPGGTTSETMPKVPRCNITPKFACHIWG